MSAQSAADGAPLLQRVAKPHEWRRRVGEWTELEVGMLEVVAGDGPRGSAHVDCHMRCLTGEGAPRLLALLVASFFSAIICLAPNTQFFYAGNWKSDIEVLGVHFRVLNT